MYTRAVGANAGRPYALLAVLTATGWAANHFSAIVPVLHEQRGYSEQLLAAVFGLYAVGLLPGLLGGGTLSDQIGRAKIAVPGACLAAGGTIILLLWHDPVGLAVGRLVVGLGAGATFSSGTAWMADLDGSHGATMAGVALTSGFGGGPVVSGLVAVALPAPLVIPFVVSLVLSVAAIGGLVASRRRLTPTATPFGAAEDPRQDVHVRTSGRALRWALPIAPFVFVSAAVGVFTLPARLPASYPGPILAGMAGGLVLGTGLAVQFAARRRGRPYGVHGLACTCAGLVLMGGAGDSVGLVAFLACSVLLGLGYGLCLHGGLSDLDRWAPPARRGALTGMFYVTTYLGFGVPLLLEVVEPSFGTRPPLFALAALAAVAGLVRAGAGRRSLSPQLGACAPARRAG